MVTTATDKTGASTKTDLMIISGAGAIQFTQYTGTTFAAGDKYLVIDASGNIHVSALGPAS